MTDAETISHLRAALERIATSSAFYIPRSKIDPETFARMTFARAILEGLTIEKAEQKAEFETCRRYP